MTHLLQSATNNYSVLSTELTADNISEKYTNIQSGIKAGTWESETHHVYQKMILLRREAEYKKVL
jgi:hypothetical protein